MGGLVGTGAGVGGGTITTGPGVGGGEMGLLVDIVGVVVVIGGGSGGGTTGNKSPLDATVDGDTDASTRSCGGFKFGS